MIDGILLAKGTIRRAYYDRDNRMPWVIGFSGGKDSSFLLQLVFDCLEEFHAEGLPLDREVHVVSSNTLVENPVVDARAKLVKGYFDRWVSRSGYGSRFTFTIVEPADGETFWINLIGRGYAAPNNTFRWCTQRLKIDPINAYVDTLIDENKGAITVLGVRKDESASRDRSISKFDTGSLYSPNPNRQGSYVFTPITEVKLVDVWRYLLNSKPLWDQEGTLNRELADLYQESSLTSDTGQCGFTIDGEQKKTCGSSRWGCWTCTLVSRDKSIESFILSERNDLQPLADYRNELWMGRDDRKNRYVGVLRVSKDSEKVLVQAPHLMNLDYDITKRGTMQVTITAKNGRPKQEYVVTGDMDMPIGDNPFTNEFLKLPGTVWLYCGDHRYPSIPAHRYERAVSERSFDAFNEEGCGTFFVHEGELPHITVRIPVLAGYTLKYRKFLLEKLLETGKAVGRDLISQHEIEEIRKVWAKVQGAKGTWKPLT